YAALDNDWRPAFRVDALPTYKTHRVAGPDDPPDDVGLQFPIILEIFDAIGLSYAEADGFEAEDVIATIAARTDEPVEVVTGDRAEAARGVVAPVADAPGRGGDGSVPTVARDPARARALAERYRLTAAVDRLIAALPSVP